MRLLDVLLRRPLAALLVAAMGAAAVAQTPQDASAYAGVAQAVAGMDDVQSVVVLQRGQPVYEFHRDAAAGQPLGVQSIDKSVLSTLVGIAIGQGRIAGVDQPVLALVPEWAPLNPDPRAAAITLRHLLTLSSGFDTSVRTGTSARDAWARPLLAEPGQRFAYDNAMVPLLRVIVEKATGVPLLDYARRELAEPLGVGGFDARQGLKLRTVDMARLGQLYLDKGAWKGRQLLPQDYVLAATQPQVAGGPPLSFPYGFGWWVIPSKLERQTFMAAGFGGQFIWVYAPLELVVAIQSTVSGASNERGQALQLIRGPIFAAAQKRAAMP